MVKHFKADKAIIVGHDWGGIVAWTYAMTHPDKTDKLVILNLPHPKGLARELANNPEQQKNSQYARDFQKPDAVANLLKRAKQGLALGGGDPNASDAEIIAGGLSFWVTRPRGEEEICGSLQTVEHRRHAQLLQGQLPQRAVHVRRKTEDPADQVLGADVSRAERHGAVARALNDTWKWVDKDLTLVTIPGAGHFVQQDAAEKVTTCMVAWLKMQQE